MSLLILNWCQLHQAIWAIYFSLPFVCQTPWLFITSNAHPLFIIMQNCNSLESRSQHHFASFQNTDRINNCSNCPHQSILKKRQTGLFSRGQYIICELPELHPTSPWASPWFSPKGENLTVSERFEGTSDMHFHTLRHLTSFLYNRWLQ